MKEVEVKLQFVTPCLANNRYDDYDRFNKDKSGNVIMMPTWWKTILEHGANTLCRHQSEVQNIKVHPIIDGMPKRYKRYWGNNQFKEHEAFLAGDIIGIKVMLPDSVPYADLLKILELAGPYKGISPYRWSEGYGNFIVVSDPSDFK